MSRAARCGAYALSERERQVVAALVAGLDTRPITQRLYISRYTIQDVATAVNASTPRSPWLSARITIPTYLTAMTSTSE